MFVRNLLYPLIWLVKKNKKRKISFKVVDRDEGFRRMKYSERVGIIVTEHTRYIANIICDCLEKCGLKGEIHINSVEKYEDIPYIIICPQFLKEFPRLYTVVQMEQTVSTRWMTQDYLNILRNAYAVFDYSMVNINYFSQDPAIASKLYYLPIDCSMKPIAELYAGETNTALIPAEVMEGPGYDWHFRHAIILRQSVIFRDGIEKFRAGAKRVVLFGDEFASAKAADYAGQQVFDMGFKGDKTQNMLWRLAHNPICGYDPHLIVVSAGRHNAGENTPEEIEAAKKRILARIRAQAPEAEVVFLRD
jgi:hypothetical protein